MKMNYKYSLIASVLLLTGLSAGAGIAQTRVVVIPMQGDNIDIYRGTLSTGNTRCSFDSIDQWDPIPCNSPTQLIDGQDAQTQYGVAPVAPPRFIINSGTVEDTLTGLIWLRQAYCAAKPDAWGNALQYIIELNSSGNMNNNNCGDSSATGNTHQTDWRLPNVRELQTLTFYGDHGPPYLVNTDGDGQWTAGSPFQSVKSDAAYWSSTTIAKQSEAQSTPPDDTLDDAMLVNFSNGLTDATEKGGLQHIWAVRDKE